MHVILCIIIYSITTLFQTHGDTNYEYAFSTNSTTKQLSNTFEHKERMHLLDRKIEEYIEIYG